MRSSTRSCSLALPLGQAAVRRPLSQLTRLALVRVAATIYFVFVHQPIDSVHVFVRNVSVSMVYRVLEVRARICFHHAHSFTLTVKRLLLMSMPAMLSRTHSHCLRLQQQTPPSLLVLCRLAWQESLIGSDAGSLQAHQGGAAVSRQEGAPAHAASAASVCPASLCRRGC